MSVSGEGGGWRGLVGVRRGKEGGVWGEKEEWEGRGGRLGEERVGGLRDRVLGGMGSRGWERKQTVGQLWAGRESHEIMMDSGRGVSV